MYIDRLQLKGFKSFGGSHNLILSPGFTAIVGPNGSGKSNLLDALRWALGDSNAGRLRISRQSDLLFQGSASLPATKEAEVVLQLREESSSCLIKRRVTAPDGATVLFVDNLRKTLAELDEVKHIWKLEGDKFAFIGQGEVAEVIKQRPSERRMRLESLFGIDIYRKRRAEAADRLATVKEEYEKLRNLMTELKNNREEIAPEVKRASQLREILDSIEEDRKLLYWLRRSSSEDAVEAAAAQIEDIRALDERLAVFRSIWQGGFDNVERKISESAKMRQQQLSDMEQYRNRFDGLIKSGFSSASALRSAGSRLAQVREDRDNAKLRLQTLTNEQSESGDENRAANEALKKSQASLDEVEEKWKEYNLRLEAEKEEREAWNQEKGNLEAGLQQIGAKLSFLGKSVLETRENKTQSADPRKEIDKDIKKFEKQRDSLLEEQDVLVKRHGELYARVQSLAAEVQRARREASQARAKFSDASEAMQTDIYPQPVQYLLSSAKLNRLDAAPVAVIDAFTCDVSLSTALEAYLGGRQFQLLVEDLEEAGRCIDKLKTNAAGRATFLPLERCRPRYPDKSFRLPSDGIIGWAIDLVDVQPHWLSAIQQIMGDVLIVDSYAVAQGIVRSGFRGPVVTAEGDVFQPGGTVSGGRTQRSRKTIELKSQILKLEQDAARASEISEKLSAEFKKTEADELSVSEQKETYTRRIRELDGQIATLADQKDSYVKEQRRLDNEKGRLFESIKTEGQNWQNILRSLAELEERWNRPSTLEEDHSIIEDRERLRAEVAVAVEKIRSKFAIMERISADIRAEERRVGDMDEEIMTLDQNCVRERSNLAHVGKSCLEISVQRNKLRSEMDNIVEGYSNLEDKREYLRKRVAAAESRWRSADDRLSRAEDKKNDTERELAELINTWEIQYPYPGKEALPDDVDLDELRRTIRDGDRKIKLFGEVNMGVLSEDQHLKDRLAFLGENLDDVRSSAAELEKLISTTDRQAHKVFTDALQEVDGRFSSLFQRLFGGGEAHLEMTDGETIWDTGVDVVARPPGKHPQGINQLSGGEQSLAAISLLFASMEVAGCPLAVLDEVDAALDEFNLRRFAELTKEYAKDRQILAMTHRRLTMERADVLYGVTLSEPALSQVIGVKMEDWA